MSLHQHVVPTPFRPDTYAECKSKSLQALGVYAVSGFVLALVVGLVLALLHATGGHTTAELIVPLSVYLPIVAAVIGLVLVRTYPVTDRPAGRHRV